MRLEAINQPKNFFLYAKSLDTFFMKKLLKVKISELDLIPLFPKTVF
jgi:hypothetical protein